VCCSVWQCVAVCCSVLQCVAVCCCCSVLQCGAQLNSHKCLSGCSDRSRARTALRVHCSVMQCVAVCCSVLYDSFHLHICQGVAIAVVRELQKQDPSITDSHLVVFVYARLCLCFCMCMRACELQTQDFSNTDVHLVVYVCVSMCVCICARANCRRKIPALLMSTW